MEKNVEVNGVESGTEVKKGESICFTAVESADKVVADGQHSHFGRAERLVGRLFKRVNTADRSAVSETLGDNTFDDFRYAQ
jgi:hypothetical protein